MSRNRYDAWGNPVAVPQGSAGVLPLAFGGQYYHANSGLYLAEFRAYDSSAGRWLSRDPLEEAGGINLYLYTNGNPIRFSDPSGLFSGADLPQFNQGSVNFSAGFGDALSFGGTNAIRNATGWNGVVQRCSGAYDAEIYSGIGYSIALGGVGSLNAGARTVFYSGDGALDAALAAKGDGLILADTLGGKLLNALDGVVEVPDSVWRAASGVLAANAKCEVQVFLRNPNPAGVWNTVERPILEFFNNTTQAFR